MLEHLIKFAEAEPFAGIARSQLGFAAVAVVVLTSLVLAMISSGWALAERKTATVRLARLRNTMHELRATIRFRNALLRSTPVPVVILPTRTRKMIASREGKALLKECLAGPDAAQLAAAMRQLLSQGEAFTLNVRTTALRDVSVRGQPVADSVALFLWSKAEPSTLDRHQRPTPTGAAATSKRFWPSAANDDCLQDNRLSIVLGADGRLRWCSESFVGKWLPPGMDISGEPHVSVLSASCAAKVGPSAIWDIVASAASDASPERYGAWGAQVGANGERVALSFSRRSDGSTLVIFGTEAQSSLAVGA